MSDLKSHVFKFPLLIREDHLDTFGHVNNAKYLEILETARWELITSNGYGLAEVHQRKVGPIILAVTLDFKKELRNRTKIIVSTQCVSYERKICKISQVIHGEDGQEYCSSVFTIGLFDFNTRRLIPPTPEWLKAIGLDK